MYVLTDREQLWRGACRRKIVQQTRSFFVVYSLSDIECNAYSSGLVFDFTATSTAVLEVRVD